MTAHPLDLPKLAAEIHAGANYVDLGVKYGLHSETIRRRLQKAGLVERNQRVDLSNLEAMTADYKSGMSLHELADKYNMSWGSVHYRLTRYAGIELRDVMETRTQPKPEVDYQTQVRPLLLRGKSPKEIAAKLGYSYDYIIRSMKRGREAAA